MVWDVGGGRRWDGVGKAGGKLGVSGNTFGGRAGVQRVTKGTGKRRESKPHLSTRERTSSQQIQKAQKGTER